MLEKPTVILQIYFSPELLPGLASFARSCKLVLYANRHRYKIYRKLVQRSA